MARQAHWYSVIQYSPDKIKGEKINVGLILHQPQNEEVIIRMLDSSNPKIKSLILSSSNNKTYELESDYLKLYLNEIISKTKLGPRINDEYFLEYLKDDLPSNFILSERTFSLTSDSSKLLSNLLDTYIGRDFLDHDLITNQLKNVKTHVKEIFLENKWLGTKIKSNVKIQSKIINNMTFNVDFAFKNGIWNLIYTVPNSQDRFTEWVSKTRTMLDIYEKESSILVLYDERDPMNKDKSIVQVIDFLKSKDPRLEGVEINSTSFTQLCSKVETDAKNLVEVEYELIAM